MKYSYNLVYSKRRSISVSISVDNVITVRCPVDYPREKVDEFLTRKSGWLDKIIEKNSQSLSINTDIISLQKAYVQGNILPVIITDKATGIYSDGIYLSSRSIYPYIYCEKFDASFLNRVKYLLKYASTVRVGEAVMRGEILLSITEYICCPEICRII